MDKTILDDIRPYYDSEVPAAIARMVDDKILVDVVNALFPDYGIEKFKELLGSIKDVNDFQEKIMHQVLLRLQKTTTDGIVFEGIEKMEKRRCYTVVSKERDIMID